MSFTPVSLLSRSLGLYTLGLFSLLCQNTTTVEEKKAFSLYRAPYTMNRSFIPQ
jgi:hypothetical protein